ncbi:MAG: lysine--tRNA ligase, partial [Ignisphaera sp.]
MSEKHRFWNFVALGIDPYLTEYRYEVSTTVSEIRSRYGYLSKGEESGDVWSIAGRI